MIGGLRKSYVMGAGELNVLKEWRHPYSRRQAFFPLQGLLEDKYWPPVGRIDNAAGDRNLVCSCPPMEDYQEAAE